MADTEINLDVLLIQIKKKGVSKVKFRHTLLTSPNYRGLFEGTDGEIEFVELGIVNPGRRIDHHVATGIILRERDGVSDA